MNVYLNAINDLWGVKIYATSSAILEFSLFLWEIIFNDWKKIRWVLLKVASIKLLIQFEKNVNWKKEHNIIKFSFLLALLILIISVNHWLLSIFLAFSDLSS